MYSHVDFDNAHADDLTSISSFAGFQTLKVLRVASIFLLGLRDGVEGGWNDRVRSFPSTLEILHISHYEKHFGHILKELWKLLLNKGQQVPKLRQILVQGPISYIRSHWDYLIRLAMLAKEQAVTIIAVNDMKDNPSKDFVERGWGMNESIKWAAGVNDTNKFPVCEKYTVYD